MNLYGDTLPVPRDASARDGILGTIRLRATHIRNWGHGDVQIGLPSAPFWILIYGGRFGPSFMRRFRCPAENPQCPQIPGRFSVAICLSLKLALPNKIAAL